MLPIAMLVLAAVAAYGQTHGTPPSVTSIRPGSNVSNFPLANVTSIGPNGWGSSATTFTVPQSHSSSQSGKGTPNGDQGQPSGNAPYYVYFFMPITGFPVVVPGTEAPTGGSEGNSSSFVPPPASTPPEPPSAEPAKAAPVPALATAPAAPEPEAPPETTILVFRDGHRLTVGNYAIVGDQMFNFSGTGPRKISLNELDLPATKRLNDNRGVDFLIPASGQ